jgi:hypothetical protein
MAPNEHQLIFPSKTDKSRVLAVSGGCNGSHLAFVPLRDAIELGLSYHFDIRQPKPKDGEWIATPLRLIDGRLVTLYNGPGYKLARVLPAEPWSPVDDRTVGRMVDPKNPEGLVWINYNRGKKKSINIADKTQSIPPGISVSTFQLEILGLDQNGRLGLDTGNKLMKNGTAVGFFVRPVSAYTKWMWMLALLLVLGVGVGAYVLYRSQRRQDALERKSNRDFAPGPSFLPMPRRRT